MQILFIKDNSKANNAIAQKFYQIPAVWELTFPTARRRRSVDSGGGGGGALTPQSPKQIDNSQDRWQASYIY